MCAVLTLIADAQRQRATQVFRIATRCKIATNWRARLLQTNLSERQPETHWQLPQYELVAAVVIGCSCGITGIAFDFAVRKGKSGGMVIGPAYQERIAGVVLVSVRVQLMSVMKT